MHQTPFIVTDRQYGDWADAPGTARRDRQTDSTATGLMHQTPLVVTDRQNSDWADEPDTARHDKQTVQRQG